MSPDKPAILGGIPLNTEKFPRYNTIGEAEKKSVMEVLESGELSGFVAAAIPEFDGGPKVRALEEEFRRHFNTKHAIAVNSATSGLYCMLMAMVIGPGDEVIVPPYTMHATASMVLQCGATPIFADIEDQTFGLDPAAVEAAISTQTRGILAVNLFGHPARTNELRAIADKYGLFLLEDNAQAPGATINGRFAGTIGVASVFSLNRHKTIQSGEGGVVITNDDRVAMKVRLVRNHGEAVVQDLGITDVVNTMGQNLRMTEMEAAVAACQVRKLDVLNSHRVMLADCYTSQLRNIPGITPPVVRGDCTHTYYFYVMRYDEEITGLSRARFVRAVNAEGYFLRAGYLRPIYMEPMYQRKICFGDKGYPFTANPRNDQISYVKGMCPVCERVQEREILITNMLYPPLSESYAYGFANAIRKVLSFSKEIAAIPERDL